MSISSSSCPNCGAEVSFSSVATVMVVCEYCDTTIVRKDLDLDKVGTMAKLVKDASPLYLGLRGRCPLGEFEIVGRLQLTYDAGLWNEWFIVTQNDEPAWIAEAMGDYTLLSDAAIKAPAKVKDLKPGQRLKLKGKTYLVSDARPARCVSGEGQLPFVVGSGYDFYYVDLRSHSNRVATIDCSGASPIVYTGVYMDFDAFDFQGPRSFDGWS
jgi:hypothetical protein